MECGDYNKKHQLKYKKRVEGGRREGSDKIKSDSNIYGMKLNMFLCEYNHNGVIYHNDVLIVFIVVCIILLSIAIVMRDALMIRGI